MGQDQDVKEKLLETIKGERKFIHELATPITVASGMTDFVISKLLARLEEKEDSIEIEKLKKAMRSLQSLSKLVNERRQKLIQTKEDVTGEKEDIKKLL